MSVLVDWVDMTLFHPKEERGKPHKPMVFPENPELQEMYGRVEGQYTRFVYEDPQTGLSISYNLYIPDGMTETARYPLVVFIGDASTVGKDAEKPIRACRGAMIWMTREEQRKHPCYVLVPQYPSVILDDHEGFVTTPYVELTQRLVREAVKGHRVDPSRVYATGQSMGCMTFMLLHAKYPDLFAACIFVDGQWEYEELEGLRDRKFIYFAAEGDPKAYESMCELSQNWKALGVNVAEVTLDAQAPLTQQDAEIRQMLAQRQSINCVTWKRGSVLSQGVPEGMIEHMFSFDPPYRLKIVRNWLFEQSLN